MIYDTQTQFSDKQVVTASAASTAINAGLVARDLGVGHQQLFLVIALVAAMTDAGSDSTVTCTLRTSATVTGTGSGAGSTLALAGSPTTLLTDVAFAALSAIGTTHVIPLPISDSYLQYLDVYYTVANGNLSTGKFTAFLTATVDLQHSYPVGYAVS